MTRLIARLGAAVRREPVRAWLYGVGVAVVGFLVITGRLDGSTGDALEVVIGAVLLVGGVERARSRVRPVDSPDAREDTNRPQ